MGLSRFVKRFPFLLAVLAAAAFAQEYRRLGTNCTETVHDCSRIRTTHTKIDYCNALRGCTSHGSVQSIDGHVMPAGKQVHIIIKVGKQYILSKFIQRLTRVTRKPVGYNFLFCLHERSFEVGIQCIKVTVSN